MQRVDPERFTDDVVEAAFKIELMDALGGAREAQSFPIGGGGTTTVSPEEIEEAKAQAEHLIRQPTIRERLCSALKSASDDLGDVAKVVAGAMIPLALGPQAVIPLSSLAFGALAVIAFRAGTRSLCSDTKGGGKGESLKGEGQ